MDVIVEELNVLMIGWFLAAILVYEQVDMCMWL